MARKKDVKFYYYTIVCEGEEGPEIVDLSNIFDGIARGYNESEDRISYTILGEQYKLERVGRPVSRNSYYHLVIEELRDYNYPSISTRGKSSRDLELEDEEFLGEKVSILYDSENNIIMMQVNRNSINRGRLELFLSALLSQQGYSVDLRLPVVVQQNTENIVRSMNGYKSMAIRTNQQYEGGKLGDLVDLIKNDISDLDTQYFDIEVKITAKEDKLTGRKFLPDSIVHEVLATFRDSSVSALKVKGRKIDGNMDVVDLISNKLSSVISFSWKENRTLNPSSVYAEMELEYNNRGRNLVVLNLME